MLRRPVLAALLLGLSFMPGRAPAQSNDPSFRIVNNTPNVVNEVYASPASERSWGTDRLGNDVIQPGTQYIVRLPPGDCVYDIRVVYQGGSAEERRGVNTCNIVDFVLGAAAQPPQQPQQPPRQQPQQPSQVPQQPRQQQGSGNPSFNLVNNTSRVIEEFYASPSSEQNWGPDRLGDAVVQPGQRFAVRLPMGDCLYDVRVVFAGGEAQERRRIDACNVTDYVVR